MDATELTLNAESLLAWPDSDMLRRQLTDIRPFLTWSESLARQYEYNDHFAKICLLRSLSQLAGFGCII